MHDEHIAAGLELQYYRIRALGGVLRHFGKGSLLHARRDVGYTCDILHSLQIEDDLCIDMRQHITLIHSAFFMFLSVSFDICYLFSTCFPSGKFI